MSQREAEVGIEREKQASGAQESNGRLLCIVTILHAFAPRYHE
jgi:hypothetical protein